MKYNEEQFVWNSVISLEDLNNEVSFHTLDNKQWSILWNLTMKYNEEQFVWNSISNLRLMKSNRGKILFQIL